MPAIRRPPSTWAHKEAARRMINGLGRKQGDLDSNDVFYRLGFGQRSQGHIEFLIAQLVEEEWVCESVLVVSAENEAGWGQLSEELLKKVEAIIDRMRLFPHLRPPGLITPHLDINKRMVIHPQGVTNTSVFAFDGQDYAILGKIDHAMTELDREDAASFFIQNKLTKVGPTYRGVEQHTVLEWEDKQFGGVIPAARQGRFLGVRRLREYEQPRGLGVAIGGRDLRITAQKRAEHGEIRSYVSHAINAVDNPYRAVATVVVAILERHSRQLRFGHDLDPTFTAA